MLSIQQAADRRGVNKGNVQAWLRAKRNPLPADALVFVDGAPQMIPYAEATARDLKIERVVILPEVLDAYQPASRGREKKSDTP